MSRDQDPQKRDMDRRDFLKRAAWAGGGVLAAGGLGLGLATDRPPAALPASGPQVTLPSYAVPNTAGRLALVHSSDRVAALEAGLKALGGLEAFLRPGDRVAIKVNAAFASPPMLGATTNPELLAALIQHCRKAGAASVIVTDNPINDPASCFELSGIGPAAEQAGAELWLPEHGFFAPTTLAEGRLIVNWPLLWRPLKGVNKLIGLAPVKDHHRSGASLSMKNWYGLLGGRRNIFHQDIHGIIAELGRLVTPTLVILDGVVSMQHNGPTGGSLDDLKHTGTLILGTDQVAADAAAAELLGKTPADLPFLGLAQRAGVGSADWRSLKPAELKAGG